MFKIVRGQEQTTKGTNIMYYVAAARGSSKESVEKIHPELTYSVGGLAAGRTKSFHNFQWKQLCSFW